MAKINESYTYEQKKKMVDMYMEGYSRVQIQAALGYPKALNSISRYVKLYFKGGDNALKYEKKKGRRKSIYYCYKGDNYICEGTMEQIANYLGDSLSFIHWINSCKRYKENDKGNSLRLVKVGELGKDDE